MWYTPPMPRGAKPKQYPPELVERVRALYLGGMSQDEVAEAVGVTQKVVWKLMIRHEIPRRPQVKRDQRGSKNHMWKGGAAGYAAFHYRVTTLRGQPKKCEECGTDDEAKGYEWASITGRFSDPGDYRRLCRSCHKRYDEVYKNLGSYAVKKGAPTP